MPKVKDKKRTQKSRQEILDHVRNNAAFRVKMTFVKEKLWPALCAATMSVDDANMLLTGFTNIVMQEFLGLMRERSMRDMKLGEKLDPESEKYEENKELLALFDDMSVFDAKEYLEGMKNEIALFQQEEMKTRPLESLQVKWVDEIV